MKKHSSLCSKIIGVTVALSSFLSTSPVKTDMLTLLWANLSCYSADACVAKEELVCIAGVLFSRKPRCLITIIATETVQYIMVICEAQLLSPCWTISQYLFRPMCWKEARLCWHAISCCLHSNVLQKSLTSGTWNSKMLQRARSWGCTEAGSPETRWLWVWKKKNIAWES